MCPFFQLGYLPANAIRMDQRCIGITIRRPLVPGQEKASLFHEMFNVAWSVVTLVVGIIAQDPKPLGQSAQHTIGDKLFFHNPSSLSGLGQG
jgi:hypothetical protein